MARFATAGLAGALILGLAGPAPAERFELVTGNDYPPYTDESLPGGGIAARIVRQAFVAQGHNVQVTFLPWKRVYRDARTGEAAAAFPYFRTPQRSQEMRYSEAIFTADMLVVSNAEAPVRFTGDLATLTRHAMCEELGYSRPGEVGELMASGEIAVAMRVPSMAKCARLVGRGRADFLMTNRRRWQRILARTPALAASSFHVAETPARQSKHYLIAGKDNARGKRAIRVFNRGLAALKAQGKLKALLRPAEDG